MRKYKAIILTVGAQADQVKFCLKKLGVEYGGFICTSTEDSKKALDETVGELKFPSSKHKAVYIEDKPDEIGKVINGFREIYDWLKRENLSENEIVVDPTGGRKWMSSGATMYASFLGLDIIYVDVKYKDGRPDPQTMKIVPLGNAYEQVGFLEEAKANELFNSYNYEAAERIYKLLATKLEDPRRVQIKVTISQSYLFWNQFIFSKAYESLQQACTQIVQYNILKDKLPRIEKQKEILNVLQNRDTYFQLLKSKQYQESALLTTFAYVERAAGSGRYDLAVIGLYRILEFISQIRLTVHGIDSENVPPEVKSKCDAKFREISRKLFNAEKGIPDELALMNGWILLYCLEDELVKGQNSKFLKDLRDRLKPRDLLWIEHKNKPAGENDYNRFRKYVESWLQKVLSNYQEKLSDYEFITF